jgi:chemotaxis protein histidine kinase CheA
MPTHYESVMKDADQMGWDVICSDTSVKLTPPSGKKGDQIVLPLTKPLAPPQLQKKLTDEGFAKALAAWEQSQAKQKGAQESKPHADAPAQQGGKQEMVCPDCVKDGVENPYRTTYPQGMGSHRRKAHGIVGTSVEAVRRREKKAAAAKTSAKKATANKTSAKKATPVKKATTAAKPAVASVPAPRTAPAPVKTQESLVNVSGLPVAVAAPLGEMLTALQTELGNAADLQKEIAPLGEFFDKVDSIVNDANLTPLKALATIQDLVAETKQK